MHALIVDDSPAAGQVALSALEAAAERLGLELDIETVAGGVEALKVLATKEVQLLLVDLHMPDLHGLEVLSFWRQRKGKGPGLAIVVSTRVSLRDHDKALEAGASTFLEKPIDGPRLLKALAPFAEAVK